MCLFAWCVWGHISEQSPFHTQACTTRTLYIEGHYLLHKFLTSLRTAHKCKSSPLESSSPLHIMLQYNLDQRVYEPGVRCTIQQKPLQSTHQRGPAKMKMRTGMKSVLKAFTSCLDVQFCPMIGKSYTTELVCWPLPVPPAHDHLQHHKPAEGRVHFHQVLNRLLEPKWAS